ncbi:hypothetical protein HDU76_006117 [Blyttiomyces sp. JEL0837]|nr:hypothetical protein HDU76_006117 [Blyttiomyces sp. JEL0837]
MTLQLLVLTHNPTLLTIPTTTTTSTTSPLINQLLSHFALSDSAKRVLETPNAGGDSIISEALSTEIITRLIFPYAKLAATEMEVKYFPMGGSMTDYILQVKRGAEFRYTNTTTNTNNNDNVNIAVSVTRAFGYNRRYTLADATRLMHKKMNGVIFAGRNLYVPEKVDKHILHVFVPDGKVAKLVRIAYGKLEEEVKGGTVVVVTICKERWLYVNTRSGRGVEELMAKM